MYNSYQLKANKQPVHLFFTKYPQFWHLLFVTMHQSMVTCKNPSIQESIYFVSHIASRLLKFSVTINLVSAWWKAISCINILTLQLNILISNLNYQGFWSRNCFPREMNGWRAIGSD